MEDGGEFSRRITHDLPRELTAFSNMSGTQSSGDLLRRAFPGVLLTHAGRLCAAIGFDLEPGRIMAITAPMILSDTNAAFHAGCVRQLLEEVLLETARCDGRTVRFVQPLPDANHSGLLTGLLNENGFSVRARILQWIRRIALDTGNDLTLPDSFSSTPKVKYEQLSGEVLETSPGQKEQVARLLREVLVGTQDLANLPLPDADELLNVWIRQRAIIVIGSRRGKNIALCACDLESSTADPGLAMVRIQYVGVVPEHRCTGVASGLIRCAHRLFLTTRKSAVEQRVQLTAFADASNQPAASLYRTCGFQIDREFDVWYCDVC